ncbi:HNH endonuclease signature motif containing protein [Fredinandcohnia sp. 179-A 10B2 NHS]|uniref:HNH endonuclease signature motif containing protein n=1 Tax=Fredinandcohnia sp. 179-A 10B2 NHS TaxID=3235176 RepID=UPI0039A12353
MHSYTSKQIAFLTENVKGRTTAELTKMFNEHFGLNLKVSQISGVKKRNKLTSDMDFTFKPGHVPFNKGKKGVGGWEPTQFKKGNKPHNHKPIGTERINGDGYVDIKIADGKGRHNWRAKHVLIWEKENGPVPKGHAIIFGDGDRRNFDINNLLLVSRKQLARLNQNGLIQNDVELTKAGVIVADILGKISELQKES